MSPGKKNTVNFYRERKIGDKHVITVDSGDWVALNEKNYRLLKAEDLENNSILKSILRDKFLILDNENRHEYVKRLRAKYQHLFTGPSLHIVAVTARCNNQCVYCHANAKGLGDTSLNMDRKTAKKTVDFIFKTKNENIAIEFQGGEPLLNFEAIRDIIEYAKKKNTMHKNLKFQIVTNLGLMDDEKLSYLMANKVGLCTSLDGPAHVHDKNRRDLMGKGTHQIVEKWIKKIKSKYPLYALMVPTRYSLKYPREIVDEYFRLGFPYIQLKPMSRLGFALNNHKINYSAEDYIRFWTEAMDYILEINKKTLFIERLSSYILRRFFFASGMEFVDLNSPCGAAISTLAYDHNGNIYSCDEGRQYNLFRLGDVSMPYGKIFESPECQNMIMSSVNDCLLCDNCAWKPYCGICVVCNYAETGNLIPVLSQNDRCRIFMAMFDYLMGKILEDKHNETFLKWVAR